jgi:hypothetical protein
MRALEARIDAEYATSFPRGGFRKGALHLLGVHDSLGKSQRGHPAADDLWEASFYSMMHAIRWGHTSSQLLLKRIPSKFRPGATSRAERTLRRGREYKQVWHAFMGFHKRVLKVARLTSDALEMEANADWMRFDVLDRLVDRTVAPDMPVDLPEALREHHQRSSGSVSQVGRTLRYEHVPNPPLVELFRCWRETPYQLPDEVTFYGFPMQAWRRCWAAAAVVGWVHWQLTFEVRVETYRLLLWHRHRWRSSLRALSGLPDSTVEAMLEHLVYDPHHRPADIGRTPLVQVTKDVLATSPMLLFTNQFERNFSAHLLYNAPTRYAQASDGLDSAMAEQLSELFRAMGFRCATGVQISTAIGSTDVDLLVWDELRSEVLSCELKWLVKPADFAEVMNRGEERLKGAVNNQLPKHAAAQKDCPSLLKRAFGLPKEPKVAFSGSCVIARGYVGSPRVPTTFPAVGERLLRQRLSTGPTLANLWGWMHRRPYLPVLDQDFRVQVREFATPSGFILRVPDYVLATDPGWQQAPLVGGASLP